MMTLRETNIQPQPRMKCVTMLHLRFTQGTVPMHEGLVLITMRLQI